MAELKDPKRLWESEATPPALRDWLDRARNDALGADAMAELVNRVESLASQPALPGAPARSFGFKALSLLAVAGAGAAVIWFLLRSSPSEHAISVRTAPSVSSSAPPPAVSVAPSASAESIASAAEPLPAPSATAKRASSASSAPSVAASITPSPRGDEFQLLRNARSALASTPTRALSLTSEHERLFPSGMLTQEREAIAIEALLRLGRRVEADARAERFLARFPTSPYRARIESARKASGP